MNKADKKKLCSGCRNNRYNMGLGYRESSVDAVVTCTECWSLEDAKVIKAQIVSVSRRPPFTGPKVKTLSCWSGDGWCKVE